jgi:hypothetical protein
VTTAIPPHHGPACWGRGVRLRGELTQGDETLAEPRAGFLHVPLEHFLGTPEHRAAAEQWAPRIDGAA